MIIKIKDTNPLMFFVGRKEEKDFVSERFPDATVFELNLASSFMFLGLVSQGHKAEITENSKKVNIEQLQIPTHSNRP